MIFSQKLTGHLPFIRKQRAAPGVGTRGTWPCSRRPVLKTGLRKVRDMNLFFIAIRFVLGNLVKHTIKDFYKNILVS